MPASSHRVRRLLVIPWHMVRAGAGLVASMAWRVTTRLCSFQRRQGGEVRTTLGAQTLLATPARPFAALDAIADTLNSCTEALSAAGVPFRVHATPAELPRVFVLARDLDRAYRSLGSSSTTWYAQIEGRTRLVRRSPGPTLTSLVSLRLHRVWATSAGVYLAGSDVGLDLVAVPQFPTAPPDIAPELGPIDAVFTWVDGSDPEWQRRMRRRLQSAGRPSHAASANAARFRSLDELKYSLRALEMYAPWIHRVHLVTDRQTPAWLRQDPRRLVVVDHQEIFEDPEALPTFNSHAIESQLHRIPGLSERYIYFNDDVFLGRYSPPSLFFDVVGGGLRVFLAEETVPPGPVSSEDPPVVAAAKRNRDLLLRLTGRRLEHKLKHVPHPQLRSLACEIEGLASAEIHATARSPFRSPNDVSMASSLLPHFAYFTGRGSVGTLKHFYADVASPELWWRLGPLLRGRAADAICLNATASDSARARLIHRFLESYYPAPSSFEQTDA